MASLPHSHRTIPRTVVRFVPQQKHRKPPSPTAQQDSKQLWRPHLCCPAGSYLQVAWVLQVTHPCIQVHRLTQEHCCDQQVRLITVFLCRYFTSKFPHLLQVTYQFAGAHCSQDPPLSTYYPHHASASSPSGQQTFTGAHEAVAVKVDTTALPALPATMAEQQPLTATGGAATVKAAAGALPGSARPGTTQPADPGPALPAVPGSALPTVPHTAPSAIPGNAPPATLGTAPPAVTAMSADQQLAEPHYLSLVDQQGQAGSALDVPETLPQQPAALVPANRARSGPSLGMPLECPSTVTAAPQGVYDASFKPAPALPASAAVQSPGVSHASNKSMLIPETVMQQQPAMSTVHQSRHQPAYLASKATHMLATGQASMNRWQSYGQQPAAVNHFESHTQHHNMASEQFPHRPGQSACPFYAKTGHCKFGPACKFDHPVEYAIRLNVLGLPLRDHVQICPQT